ncbi:MAG: group II truncated hemoglobin [Gammaproteobacteria bacterium]|nr:group II truncated hemoglobin [Gammaproteobacteria bacterium]
MENKDNIIEKTAYELIGGEEKVQQLVDHFYDIMDDNSDFSQLRQLHAKSLKASREKLFLFLSGWLGGPNLYIEKYGHPRLRRRHMPFKIGDLEAGQWVKCMQQAMDKMEINGRLREFLEQSFLQTAMHMRNQ